MGLRGVSVLGWEVSAFSLKPLRGFRALGLKGFRV